MTTAFASLAAKDAPRALTARPAQPATPTTTRLPARSQIAFCAIAQANLIRPKPIWI